MKHLITLFVLTSSLAIWQGCTPKTEKENETVKPISEATTDAKFVKASSTELAARRERLAKARAEKELARQQALAEKAKATPTYRDATGTTVYYKAEIDPSYNGGVDAMRKYLRDNINYPQLALEKGYEGTVFVEFVVDTKGRVREVVADDMIGDDVDMSFKKESIRVVSSMPLWTPGRQNGKAVDTSFSLPITFEVKN